MRIKIAAIVIIFFCLFIIGIGVAWAPIFPIVKTQAQPQAPAPLPPTPATTTLIFGGDVMLSRNVGQKMEKYQDWSWPMKNIAGLLSAADLAVVNLESPFTLTGSHLVKTGSFSFNADPRAITALTSAGIDIVSLANNHITNQSVRGLKDTAKLLQDNGIGFTGAGTNETAARQPAIKELNGKKFGFLSYAYPDDYSVAATSSAGLANMDIAKMTADVNRLKQQADIVIILMHAGVEYKNTPNNQQKQFARAAIDAGADLVVGHHPHWVQTTEIYQDKPIIYSLGILVFDQMWSTETQQGALAQVVFSGRQISSIKIIPIKIIDYGQAAIATGTDKTMTLKRMGLNEETLAGVQLSALQP